MGNRTDLPSWPFWLAYASGALLVTILVVAALLTFVWHP